MKEKNVELVKHHTGFTQAMHTHYSCTHTCVHVCMHTHTHTHMQSCTHTHTHLHTHTLLHTHTPLHTHITGRTFAFGLTSTVMHTELDNRIFRMFTPAG